VNLHASAKSSSFTESVIREMTRLAAEHDAINLGQGYPDFPAPEGGEGSRPPRDRGGPQPVPDHVGRSDVPPRDRGEVRRRLRHER
jgi:Aspartate/tyrosine/aromatic aminotransferase